jgi:hypothetical protein
MKKATARISPEKAEALESTQEAGSLAHELAKAHKQLVEYHRKEYKVQSEAASGKAEKEFALTSTANVQRILETPARNVSWLDLDQLAAVDPEMVVKRWEGVKAEARAELMSGHRAAAPLETAESNCWQRAQFLAIRDSLSSDWQPRNGIEWTLIDAMVQAWTMQMFWTQRTVMVDAIEWPEPPSKEMAKWQPPRLGQSLAIDQAAGMVDRFNRIFMRALRQLRDLRRYTVVIQSAGQVNVGQQQVNVAAIPKAAITGPGGA